MARRVSEASIPHLPGNCINGYLKFVVPALAGISFFPPKGGTTNNSLLRVGA